jgi:hypothetical protein
MKRFLKQIETPCKTNILTIPPKGYIYIERVFDLYIINGILNYLKKRELHKTINGCYLKFDIILNKDKYNIQENGNEIEYPELNDLLDKIKEITKNENIKFDFNQILIYQYNKENRQERMKDNSLGESLIIISFTEPCEMLMLQQLEDNKKNIYKTILKENSLFILSNEAKYNWKFETLKPTSFQNGISKYKPTPNYKRTTITLRKI